MKIVRKSESWLMKLISLFLFFNKDFMNGYVTTIGRTIYIPNLLIGKEDTPQYKSIIAHEYVHILDSERDKLFKLKYLFPQILSLLTIFVTPFTLWGLLFLLFLAPIPAIWRKTYEVRAYKMSLASMYLLLKSENFDDEKIDKILKDQIIHFNKQFVSSAYYWMWPFGVKKELTESIHSIKSGDIFKDDSVYEQARNAVLDI